MLWCGQLLNNGGKDINCDWLRVLTGGWAAEETLLMHLADHFGGAGSHFVQPIVLCDLHNLLCFVLCPIVCTTSCTLCFAQKFAQPLVLCTLSKSLHECDDLCACIYSSPTNLCSAIARAIKSSHLTIWTNQLFIHAVPSLDTAPRPRFPYNSRFVYTWFEITRPSILCVTHQMSRKKRHFSVGWTAPYQIMNYKWYLMVLGPYMTILAGT